MYSISNLIFFRDNCINLYNYFLLYFLERNKFNYIFLSTINSKKL